MNFIVQNFVVEDRIYESMGLKFRHLGSILMGNRTFIIYETLSDNKKYIEEKITNKLSEILYSEDVFTYIEDEELWLILLKIAQKEGILQD